MRKILVLALICCACATDAPADSPSAAPAPAQNNATQRDLGEGAGRGDGGDDAQQQQPPDGYYAFVESPNAEPPRVRPPPYSHAPIDCREDDDKTPHVTPFNLCGDLNRGTIPRNPMGQNVLGMPYPFEVIKNMTLKYLSRTLPILKADETLPKVAQMQDDLISQNTISHTFTDKERVKRETPILPSKPNAKAAPTPLATPSTTTTEADRSTGTATTTVDPALADRQSRKFCDQGGVFCMLYKAINGEPATPSVAVSTGGGYPHRLHIERRDDGSTLLPVSSSSSGGSVGGPPPSPQQHQHRYEGPPTPCPAKVEYATPVFAKNYQGVWRYVVQIPYEGYFTQTVEVTRCLQSRCHYLDGGCLSSPRWSSLLVAEIYYPDTVLASPDMVNNPPRSPVAAPQPPSVQDFQNYQQYLHKRAGLQAGPASDGTTTPKPTHCDGVDALGCFQVRLYYDWFLIPGSCKCWRPDYFNKYVRRKNSINGADL